jgi:hypothetical protein
LRDQVINQLLSSSSRDDQRIGTTLSLELLRWDEGFEHTDGSVPRQYSKEFANDALQHTTEILEESFKRLDAMKPLSVQSENESFERFFRDPQILQDPTRAQEALQWRSPNGYHWYHCAASMNDPDIINRFFESFGMMPGVPKINDPARNGWTPLHEAIFAGHQASVDAILSLGGMNNTVAHTPIGLFTPLTMSVLSLNANILKSILAKKPDVWFRDDLNFRRTVAHQVAVTRLPESIHLLLQHDSALVSARDSRIRTPLHYAAAAGNIESIRLFLGYGAEINAEDVNGQTPLHICWAQLPHFRRNPDLGSMFAPIGVSLLDLLAEGKESREFLIQNGADTKPLNRFGWTPSQWAFSGVMSLTAAKGLPISTSIGPFSWEGAGTNCPSMWVLRRLFSPPTGARISFY